MNKESNQQPQRCEENMNQVEMSAEVVVAGTAVPLKARCGLCCMRLHLLVCSGPRDFCCEPLNHLAKWCRFIIFNVGGGEALLSETSRQSLFAAPCNIFFDEDDVVASRRRLAKMEALVVRVTHQWGRSCSLLYLRRWMAVSASLHRPASSAPAKHFVPSASIFEST